MDWHPVLGAPVSQLPQSPQCLRCFMTFRDAETAERHLRFKHPAEYEQQLRGHTVFACCVCDRTFPSSRLLSAHQRTHSKSHAALKPFECPDCGMVFRHRSVMEDHRRKHAEERTHHCNLCGKRFKYSSLLQQHQAHWRQHRKCTHRCLRCSLSFLDLTSLQAHMLSHGTVEVSATRMSANSRSGVQRINSCPLCPLTFPDVASLKAHMLIHEADEAFGGRGRGTSSNGEDQDTTTFVCPCCHVTLPDQRSLEIHMVSHITPQQATNVLSRVAVNNGMEVLRGNWVDPLSRKMLKCIECEKTFRHRSVLELHMRIHSRDKPFQCKVCGKAFKFSSYLQQHLIIHTGQKPFKCPDCGKDFAFLQNMKTHQRLHQGIFDCGTHGNGLILLSGV
uniref:C2H2-type domain-containing protein n=1 Tax=Scleropages formosus TaxID=113540 RepID=A0A8C9VXS2_SCLFO